VTSGNFQVRDERSLHAWAMFDLKQRTIASPGGVVFERTHVSTPGAVGVVAVTENDQVILVRQYRASLGARILEIPAGMRDVPGEDPSVTAARELEEETGYTASSFVHLGRILSAPGVTDSVVEIYRADGLDRGDSAPHGPEEDDLEVLLVPFHEALRMVDGGEITDSKTVVGLLAEDRRRWSART
jgi:ADP-ribose pyrophosphatase